MAAKRAFGADAGRLAGNRLSRTWILVPVPRVSVSICLCIPSGDSFRGSVPWYPSWDRRTCPAAWRIQFGKSSGAQAPSLELQTSGRARACAGGNPVLPLSGTAAQTTWTIPWRGPLSSRGPQCRLCDVSLPNRQVTRRSEQGNPRGNRAGASRGLGLSSLPRGRGAARPGFQGSALFQAEVAP